MRAWSWRKALPLALLVVARAASAQLIAPQDDAEAKRFAEASAAAGKVGVADGAVLWHGEGKLERLLLVGTPGESGGLALVVFPAKKGAPAAVALDSIERLSGPLSVEVKPLFEKRGIFDVVIVRRPFQLETSSTRVGHDIVSLGAKPARLCHVDGTNSASSARGPESVTSTREVDVEPDARAGVPTLVVTTRDVEIVRRAIGNGGEQRKEGASTTRRIEIAGGRCRDR